MERLLDMTTGALLLSFAMLGTCYNMTLLMMSVNPGGWCCEPAGGSLRKVKQHKKKSDQTWGPKWDQIFEIRAPGVVWSSRAIPLGAKMAQDAIWDASGAPFGGLVGRIMAPGWTKLGPRWR